MNGDRSRTHADMQASDPVDRCLFATTYGRYEPPDPTRWMSLLQSVELRKIRDELRLLRGERLRGGFGGCSLAGVGMVGIRAVCVSSRLSSLAGVDACP